MDNLRKQADMTNRTCSAPSCIKPKKTGRKYCAMHSARMERRGSLDLPENYPGKQVPLEESLASKTQKSSAGCWEWTGAKNAAGYGQIRRGRKIIYVHRLAYETNHGPIPDGMFIDHMCRNTVCVNPKHLRLATPTQNSENLSNLSNRAISGHRGVVVASNGRWQARVAHDKRVYFGGTFEHIDDAMVAVTALRMKLHTHNLQDRLMASQEWAE